MMDLRPYQTDLIARFECLVEKGVHNILIVVPTGGGKTLIGSAIIKGGTRRVLMVAHRREIVNQTSAKLTAFGVHHGVIQAGDEHKLRPMASVQVASIQTLHARAIRSTSMPLPLVDLIIIDEAHHACAATYGTILDAYPDAVVLGLTATPCRGDGRGLGSIFATMLEGPQVADLIELGHLVKTRVYAPIDPNLAGVETRSGDYIESQLAERMDRIELVGDIVTHWHKYGQRRKTVAFASSVGHSIHICEEFVRAGVRAEHLDGHTPTNDRVAILDRLASGQTEVVCNCMILTEGFDMPEIGCCILARPTKKMGLFRQMIGRVLRPAENKLDAVVLDHSGAVFRHGLPDDRVAWSLDPDLRAIAPEHRQRLQDVRKAGLLQCSECSALRLGGKPCPACGFMPRRAAELLPTAAGELGLVEGGKAQVSYSPMEKAEWHGMLAAIAVKHGYKSGWVAHQFKKKFGEWPPSSSVLPIEPSAEVRSWVRSRMIAYANAKQRAPA